MNDATPVADTAQATPGGLRQLLSQGTFVLTAEIVPPPTTRRRAVLDKALPLKGFVDAVNVTDGANARVHVSALAAAGELARAGIDPILQMTCRDRNRISLQGDILGAAMLGVRNLLIMRGDDPAAGDQPDAKPVFDLEVTELLTTAATIRDGHLPSGRDVDGRAPFLLGAADMPIDPPPGWRPDRLRAKIEAGAEFAQTQICMDPGLVERYAARLVEEGLGGRLALIVGVAVPASARSARWMRDKLFGAVIPDALVARLDGANDERAEARRACAEMIQALAETPGVAGAHVMAPLNEESILAAIEGSGIRKRRS